MEPPWDGWRFIYFRHNQGNVAATKLFEQTSTHAFNRVEFFLVFIHNAYAIENLGPKTC